MPDSQETDILQLALKFRDESASPEKSAAIAAKRARMELGANQCRSLIAPLTGHKARLRGELGVLHVRSDLECAFLDFVEDVKFTVDVKLPDGRIVPETRHKAGTVSENILTLRKDELGFVVNQHRCKTPEQVKQIVAKAIGPFMEP